MSPITPQITVALAVLMAVLGSFGLAAGSVVQHSAVVRHSSVTSGRPGTGSMTLRQITSLLTDRRWLAGMAIIVTGTLLNVAAIFLAPVSVVQPVGVLAVVWSVLLAARIDGSRHRPPRTRKAVWAAILVTIAGLAGFTALSAGHAGPPQAPDLGRAGVIAMVATTVGLVLAASHRLARPRDRALLLATSGAVLYGVTAALVKLVSTLLAGGQAIISAPVLLTTAGIVAAALIGGFIVQQAYAAGRAEVTVGALTTIDPIVAVVFGMVALGEGADAGAPVIAAMAACGAVAALGIASLSRFQTPRPQTPRSRIATTTPTITPEAPMTPHVRRDDLSVAVVSDYSLAHLGGAENAYADQVRSLATVARVLAVNPPSRRLDRLGERDGVTAMPVRAALTLPGLCLPVIRNTAGLRARLRQAFIAHGVDVVHVHSEFGLAAAAVQTAQELGIPTVATVHTFFWQTRAPVQRILAGVVPRFHRMVTGLEPSAEILAERPGDSALRNMTLTLARRVDRVVSPSAHQAAGLRKSDLPRIDVVPNSAPANPDAAPLTRVDGPLRVLWIGRFAPEKRVVPFVEAALTALDAVGPDNLRVDLIGTGPQFCRVARMIDARPGIHLTGALPNELIGTHLRRSHVTVLSSIGWDNQPMTIAESVTALRGVIWCDPALTEGLVAAEGLPGAGIPAFGGQVLGRQIADKQDADLASTLAALALSPGPVIEASRRALAARQLFTADHFTASVLDVYRRAGVHDRAGSRHITSPAELENAS